MDKGRSHNRRLGKIAAVTPQKRQCEFGSYYPAGTLVKPLPRQAAGTFENDKNPYEERRDTIADWKKYACAFCVENDHIITYAETLFSKGIKVKDALHIACAVDANADFFITTDKKLTNKVIPEIKIINPLMVINELNN